MVYVLRRRQWLKAAGAAAVGLPALELTAPSRVRAGGMPPKRYVFMYCGLSIGRDGAGELVTPDIAGAGYDLKRALLPLGTEALPYGGTGFDVQNEVSVVSGLRVPWSEGGAVPPGGKSPEFHYNSVGPLVSGVRGPSVRTNAPQGPSSDQLINPHLVEDPQMNPLSYRVQPAKYVGSNGGAGDAGRISWMDDGGGQVQGIDPFSSPRLAYESMFTNFVPPDPAEAAAAAFMLERRRSVADMVRARTESLIPKLTPSDKERMERHLDELRNFETKLDSAPPPTTGACEMLPDPGEDPPIGGAHADTGGGHEYTQSAAYSNEDLRAEIMCDLIRMSFACDLNRVAAIRLTIDQCFMNMFPLTGAPGEVHEMSHGQAAHEDHGDAVGWHVKHFARLVSMLRDTQEIDGSSLLDHTAVVLMFEGGFGYDPEGGSDNRAHSTENMVALVGGRAGGLTGGQHIVAPDAHPCQVTLSAMQAAGYPEDSLGEISGTIPDLFG